jgi:hypothetical protein
MELYLDEEAIDEMAALANFGKQLPNIVSKIAVIGPRAVLPVLADELSKQAGLDNEQAVILVQGLVRVYNTRERSGESTRAVIDALTAALKDNPVRDAWEAARDKVVEAVDLLQEEHPLVVSSKAERVAISKANRVVSMDLFTDARPVFNKTGDRVLFTVIDHVISLEYHADYRDHREIHLTFDADDIERLFDLCLEAKARVTAVKDSIKGPSGLPFEGGNEE